MYKNKFSEIIKQLLKEHNLSISELAHAVNIPQNTLGNFVNGIREIRIENLCKIADYFDITLDELCGRE